MATTQKKTTKSAPKKSGGTKKGTKRMAAPPPYNHGLRLTIGVVFLLLALCVLVSYFGGEATVLDFLSKVLKGLFGYGYYLVAPALGYCGWSLIDHKKKPVILRSFCILVLPLLLGTLLHLFLCKGEYGYEMQHPNTLPLFSWNTYPRSAQRHSRSGSHWTASYRSGWATTGIYPAAAIFSRQTSIKLKDSLK